MSVPVRAHRLFRRQRRLDQREALALAVGFEVLRDLRFHLLRAQFLIFRRRILVVTRELAIFLLDLRRHRDLALVALNLRAELIHLRRHARDVVLRRFELRLNRDVRRVIGDRRVDEAL